MAHLEWMSNHFVYPDGSIHFWRKSLVKLAICRAGHLQDVLNLLYESLGSEPGPGLMAFATRHAPGPGLFVTGPEWPQENFQYGPQEGDTKDERADFSDIERTKNTVGRLWPFIADGDSLFKFAERGYIQGYRHGDRLRHDAEGNLLRGDAPLYPEEYAGHDVLEGTSASAYRSDGTDHEVD